jgi:hypothetical protein
MLAKDEMTINRDPLDWGADFDDLPVDSDHDGPWLSCMARDGSRMYRNRSVPSVANLSDRTVYVDDVLKQHEGPEWVEIQVLLAKFREENGREPSDDERVAIYEAAHEKVGTPSERRYCESEKIDWDRWSAWCRGWESKVEALTPENPPHDADVRPAPHRHGELEAEDGSEPDSPGHDDGIPAQLVTKISTEDCALDEMIALDEGSVREMDDDGRMRVSRAHISKANVCPYRGAEIPDSEKLGLDPDRVYQLYRDPEELAKAAPTFRGVQILRRHVPVSADDHHPWDVVGSVGSNVEFVDPYLDADLTFWTGDAVADIESGRKQQLSCGYRYRADMTPGVAPDGTRFDGVMRDIFGNHLSQVELGRAGADVVVGDSVMGMDEQKRDEHGQFAANAGYKEVAHSAEGQPWQWAKKIAEHKDKTTHSLNIKHAGTPPQFIATRMVKHPQFSGAGTVVGKYPSFIEAHEAGTKAIKSLPGAEDMAWDSTENETMTTKLPTRFAYLACEVASAALRPLLAADQKVDIMPVFRDVTAKNFKADKIRLALDEVVKGKLAKDATTESMMPMMSAMEHAASPATSDESVSPEQHRAMMAAAGGNSTLGIPKNVGEEFAEADKGKKFGDGPMHDQICSFLEGKLSPEDMEMVRSLISAEGHQEDAMPEALRNEERAGEDVAGTMETQEKGPKPYMASSGARDKAARDKAARDKAAMDGMVSRTAMDAALRAMADASEKRTAEAVRQAQDQFRVSQREIADALSEVRPKVGDLPAIAFDSAEAVRRHALKVSGIAGHDTIHASALSSLVAMLPSAGARPSEAGGRELAMDEDATKRRELFAPGLSRIQAVA